MKNYIVFDIGGSSVKWSVINNKGVILISGKIAIAETIEGFFEELSNKVNN